MRKIVGVVALAALVVCGFQPVQASVLGFETGAAYYNARDSRYQGVGTDVGINFHVDDSLVMGYKVEELALRGSDKVGAGIVTSNANVTFQGITAFYRAFAADDNKVTGEAGFWTGSATTADITGGAGAGPVAEPLASAFIEPEVKIGYNTNEGKVATAVKFGLGYRFVRNVTAPAPFGVGTASALKDLDGLDINLSVGLMF